MKFFALALLGMLLLKIPQLKELHAPQPVVQLAVILCAVVLHNKVLCAQIANAKTQPQRIQYQTQFSAMIRLPLRMSYTPNKMPIKRLPSTGNTQALVSNALLLNKPNQSLCNEEIIIPDDLGVIYTHIKNLHNDLKH